MSDRTRFPELPPDDTTDDDGLTDWERERRDAARFMPPHRSCPLSLARGYCYGLPGACGDC